MEAHARLGITYSWDCSGCTLLRIPLSCNRWLRLAVSTRQSSNLPVAWSQSSALAPGSRFTWVVHAVDCGLPDAVVYTCLSRFMLRRPVALLANWPRCISPSGIPIGRRVWMPNVGVGSPFFVHYGSCLLRTVVRITSWVLLGEVRAKNLPVHSDRACGFGCSYPTL